MSDFNVSEYTGNTDDFYNDTDQNGSNFDLPFQDFSPSSGGSGGSGGSGSIGGMPNSFENENYGYNANLEGSYGVSDFDKPLGQESMQQSDAGEEEEAVVTFWNIEFYRQWFEVDSLDIAKRIFYTLFIYPNFFDTLGDNPDLYGPFWIPTTLVFIVAAVGNFATYLSYLLSDRADEFTYDFEKVTIGAMMIYTYLALLPLCIWAVLRYIEISVSLIHNFAIFGYSLFPYILAAIVMVIPNAIARWCVLAVAFLFVCAFFTRSYATKCRSQPAAAAGILVAIFICNLLMVLVFGFYFFHNVSVTAPPPSPGPGPIASPTPTPTATPSPTPTATASATPMPTAGY